MDGEILRELRIQNLLTALSMIDDENAPNAIKQKSKILDYIFNTEVSNLQLDVALFPKKEVKQQNYKFHDI